MDIHIVDDDADVRDGNLAVRLARLANARLGQRHGA